MGSVPKTGPTAAKFTKARADAIVKALEKGHAFKHACALAGISFTTGYRWLDQGRAGESDPGKAKFAERVEEANAKAAEYALGHIRSAMPKDWRASMAFLERRFPDEYTKRERHEISGPKDGPVEIVVTWPTGAEPPR
jgi:transposase